MTDRLPPLTALRAFEAAARHMSFAKAAEELNVTPAALSFQIKSLEEHLGEPVFRRLNRAVELNAAGRALAPGTSEGFARIQQAWSAAKKLQQHALLTVTAGPALISKWLVPRLSAFAEANPDIDLRLSAGFRMLDLDRDEVDVALRFTANPDPKLRALSLGPEWFAPVMTPELAERFPDAESLTRAPLLVDESVQFLKPPCDWPAWFRAVGIDFRPEHGVHFSQADHALDAALSGTGIMLGWRSIAGRDVEQGNLVMPIPVALQSDAQVYFLCQPGSEDRPEIALFRDWVQAEYEQSAHIGEPMQCHLAT